MAVPDFQSFPKPLLDFAADGEEHSIMAARDFVAVALGISEADRNELLPSGQSRFNNRVAWAKTFFVKARILESTQRGHFRITERGRGLLAQGHSRIDFPVLDQYPEFVRFRRRAGTGIFTTHDAAPEERIQQAYEDLNENLAGELVNHIQDASSQVFRQLVVDLMAAMGYGGSRTETRVALSQYGDHGFWALIKADRLGLEYLYLLAKRLGDSIDRAEVERFVNALNEKSVKAGVFITTEEFTEDAIGFAKDAGTKVVLIDGWELANLMVEFNVGITTVEVYTQKKIDYDYFGEEW